MSEVISFRLDPNNTREAQAFDILHAWQEKGYRTRDILTKALLQLNEVQSINAVMDDMAGQLQYLSRKLDGLSVQSAERTPAASTSGDLFEEFKVSLQNTAKPGLKVHGKKK